MAGPIRGTLELTNVKPPRPRNSWIIYRADTLKTLPKGRMTQAQVSQIIGKMWREVPTDVRKMYDRLALEEKIAHALKYPLYKYEPVRKEDRDREKKDKKERKDKERAAKKLRRTGQTSGNIPIASASLPYASLCPPSMPYYYPSPMPYDPAGPSPPLSVASSPIEASLSPASCAGLMPQAEENSAHTPFFPTSYPVLPPSSRPTTASNAPIAQLPFPLVPEGTPSLESHHQTQWQEQASQDQGQVADTSLMAHSQTWDDPATLSLSQSGMDNVYFDLPQTVQDSLQAWLQQDTLQSEGSFQAMMSSTDDPSIFQLHNFDQNTLSSNPQGEIEVTMGSMLEDPTISAFLGTMFSGEHQQLQMSHEPAYSMDGPVYHPSEYTTSVTDSYSLEDFVNLEPHGSFTNSSLPITPSTEFSSLSGFQSRSSSVPAPAPSSTPYAPPAGAAYSSNRRVGGSYKSFHSMDAPVDPSPPRGLQVRAT